MKRLLQHARIGVPSSREKEGHATLPANGPRTGNGRLNISASQCVHCMQSKTARKPTISLRLPQRLLEEIDGLVRRTRMRSRTEFLERAVEAYVEELREARIVVVTPWTRAKARAAILRYLMGRRATYVTDVAE
ncbi:MAG: ribbon-helix-helix domain-containing protein, partial [Methanobacteriota archaeon]